MTALFMRWVLPRVAIAFAVASAPIAMSGVGAGAVAPLSAHVSPQSFEGTFTGSGVVLELHFDTASSRYLGSFSEGPQTAPVDLAPKGASLVGAYVSGAVPRTLVVTRVGDGLVIERGDHRSLLVRMRSDDRTSQRRALTKALSAARVVAGGAASPLFQASGIEFPALPAQPQPAGQPAALPVAQPAPVIPVIPVAPPAAVPSFVRAGMRLTYQLGSSSSPRAGSNDGPTGAQSYQQVTITGIDNGIVATEVRSLARDVNARAVYNIQTDGYLLPIEQGTDYWMRPQKLAAIGRAHHEGHHVPAVGGLDRSRTTGHAAEGTGTRQRSNHGTAYERARGAEGHAGARGDGRDPKRGHRI